MKLAFTTLACPDWDLDQIIDCAVTNGYEGVDFRGYRREMAIFDWPEFSTDIAITADRMASAGLAVPCLSAGAKLFATDPAHREKHLSEVTRYGEMCSRFDCDMIRVFGGPIGETDRAEAIDIAAGALAAMARRVLPVRIVVETHDDWSRSEDLAALLAAAEAGGAKNVAALWDLHHPYRAHGESPATSLANLAGRIAYTHVKNSLLGPDGKIIYCLGDDGDVPLGQMIDGLRSIGYDGWITLEWEKRWHEELADPEVALPAYAKYLRELI